MVAALVFIPFLVSALVPHHGLAIVAFLGVTVVAWRLAVATVVWPRRRAGVAGFTGNARATIVATWVCAVAVLITTLLPGGNRATGFVSIVGGALAALGMGWVAWRQARSSAADR